MRTRIATRMLLLLAALAAAPAAAEEPRVAVLPFRVHSAQPIEFLGESVASLLQEKLEESGSLFVVDREVVRASLQPGPAPAREEPLREVAESLRAEYVVSGSLTELAGSYSLDVRVTPRRVGARPQTQVVTAGDEDELLQRVAEVADRIAEHLRGAAPPRVAAVEIVGPPQAEGLRSLLRTREGEVFDPRSVEADVVALAEAPGIDGADYETHTDPEGVIVRFRVVASERVFPKPAQVAEGESVADVVVRGNRRIESAAVKARLGTAAGRPYRPRQIAQDVRNVYDLGFFRNVQVLTDRVPRGLIVIFEVEENPVVRQISISGNDNSDGDEIRDILTLTTGTTLDYPLLFENSARITELYKGKGYYLAEVEHEVETLSETSVGIHFIVIEGKKLKLRTIAFEGNEAFSDGELRKDFKTKRWRFWSLATSWFDKSGTYSEPVFFHDLNSVNKLYADAGYLQVEIKKPDVKASEDGIELVVEIVEGPQFRVGQVDLAGDETADLASLEAELELEEGEIFNRSELTRDVDRLKNQYTNRGFFYATVEPQYRLNEGSQIVDVVYQVRRGPLYFIRQVDIAGNTTTVDPVIRREIPLVEGELYSQRKLDIARGRIQRLGFFEEVDLRVEPTSDPQQLDLEVSVVERPTGSFSFGAGFSSQDSFLVNGSLSQSNLFGRGYAVNLSADIGQNTQRFFFSIQDPSFLGTDWAAGLTAFRQAVRFESFDQEETGVSTVFSHALSEDGRTIGTLRYGFTAAEIPRDLDFLDGASLILRQFAQSSTTTSIASITFAEDKRNDRFSPTDGHVWAVSGDFAGLGGFSKFLRFEGSFTKYFPAPRWIPIEGSTFVVGGRIGYAVPFNSIGDFDLPQLGAADIPSQRNCIRNAPGLQCRTLDRIDTDATLPLTERYFLGGIGRYQLRGFRARSVGPRAPILAPVLNLVTPEGDELRSGALFAPLGRDGTSFPIGECPPTEECNDIDDRRIADFENLEQTDVIGGNSFISLSFEYRFPISETFGLQGIGFIDMGNAFREGDLLFDVTKWRFGAGGAVQWFSPFGPIMLVLGFPIDRIAAIEDSPIFEFSVGGG